MQLILRYAMPFFVALFAAGTLLAQSSQWRAIHEVKKKETVFGISQQYGISIDQLRQANPQLAQPGYRLKNGERLFIPFAQQTSLPAASEKMGTPSRPIRLGVMLPLHDKNGDGRRMVEYYRGVLMACDSLKKLGVSIDIRTWNTAEESDISSVLRDPDAASRDLIIGPLYSAQMQSLSDFVSRHAIKLVIPFSISAPQVSHNPNLFQVYQAPSEIDEATVRRAVSWFKDCHPVIIDCGDKESTKGSFTTGMRKGFEQRGIAYSLTSLESPASGFLSAFDSQKRNIVILNSSRLSAMETALEKLTSVQLTKKDVSISLLGFSDWLAQAQRHQADFCQFDTYIPSPFFTNVESPFYVRLKQKYRWNFHQDMQALTPRFALTGFDQAFFFLNGFYKYGKSFDGAEGRIAYTPVQTPLKFVRAGSGGWRNRAYMFVHYMPNRQIETISY